MIALCVLSTTALVECYEIQTYFSKGYVRMDPRVVTFVVILLVATLVLFRRPLAMLGKGLYGKVATSKSSSQRGHVNAKGESDDISSDVMCDFQRRDVERVLEYRREVIEAFLHKLKRAVSGIKWATIKLPMASTEYDMLLGVPAKVKEGLCSEGLALIYGPSTNVIKTRPNWLRSPHSNRNLELDSYVEDKRVAVEYNGSQHYIFTDRRSMVDRVEKDLSKLNQTRKHGVQLVVVPYIVPSNGLLRHIALGICGRK